MLGLLTGDKKQLALKDLDDLRFDKFDVPRETMIQESILAMKVMLTVAKRLDDEGRIFTPD